MVARTRSQTKHDVRHDVRHDAGRIQKPMRERWHDDGVGHPAGWTAHGHYMTLTYEGVSATAQCGSQSCPCCRARVYRSGVDPGALMGACSICVHAP